MPLSVFYLDDEKELCENFVDYFESDDIQIRTFTDPKEAIKAINENAPDLFFVDYRLPGTTGDQIAQSIDPKIPKFLITGESSPTTEYQFEKIFGKPYRSEEIAKVLSHYSLSKKQTLE